MKPKVFLSHSKRDSDFIARVANDLRYARIDSWYDDWEIPPGESLRKKIFKEAIPSCDLFFTYVSEHALESVWCQRELDAAFVQEFEQRGGFLAVFVDSDRTRDRASLDIRSLKCPVLNQDEYSLALYQLIARSWEAYLEKQMHSLQESHKAKRTSLEKH